MDSLTVLEGRSLRSRFLQLTTLPTSFPSEGSGGGVGGWNPFHASLLASGAALQSLEFLVLQMHHSSLFLCHRLAFSSVFFPLLLFSKGHL